MGLSAIILAWLDHLGERSVIPEGCVFELGPQDVFAPEPVVDAYLTRRLGPERAAAAHNRMYGPSPLDRPQTEIYGAIGLTEYVSLDYGDTRADISHNLNEPLDTGRRFQAVTNFGTAEHIFNVSTVLQTQYRHLAVGGVALYFLPTYGEINHGFYNIHPTVFTDLAAANAMEIVDMQYVDDVIGRNRRLDDAGSCQFDFDSLPIEPLKGQYGNFNVVVAMNFFRNTANHMKATPPDQVPTAVFDACMVALRRTADSPPELRAPQQASYALHPRQGAKAVIG